MSMSRALAGVPPITTPKSLSRASSSICGLGLRRSHPMWVGASDVGGLSSLRPLTTSSLRSGESGSVAPKKSPLGSPLGLPLESPLGSRIIARAAEIGASGDFAVEGVGEAKRFPIELYFTVWWSLNAVFNIYNKKVLNAFPFPWLTSVLSLAMGSAVMLAMWGLRVVEPPDVDGAFWQGLAPVAVLHTVGFVAATVSLSRIAVSSHHIIKSLEPACSVIVSKLFMGESFPVNVYLSIVPIIGGCGLAAATELNFSVIGFVGAMISNVAFVYRNIASKKGMKQVGGMNYYACLSMMSCVLLLPFAFAVEGPSVWAAGWHAAVLSVGSQFPLWVGLQCLLYHLHNQVSYMSLDQISPLSFSIGNTMKRVTVIVTAILIFRTPVRPINAFGAAIAILGTFLYSQAK